ncbi:MAG: hypothetical protein J5792_06320, partial [Bacteroidales bacterium]|nr:hypothetical protein [Bacteroidales bacterium]
AGIKKLGGEVAGDADCLVFPNIESGNVFYKCNTKLAGAELAAMVCGARVPCVLTSRGDTAKTKSYSIALAALMAKEIDFSWRVPSRGLWAKERGFPFLCFFYGDI